MAGLVPAIHVLPSGTKNVDDPDEPGHDGVLASQRRQHAKLLRGQAFADMSDFESKVVDYCGKSRLETLKSVNFSGIGSKFLAVQRHTF